MPLQRIIVLTPNDEIQEGDVLTVEEHDRLCMYTPHLDDAMGIFSPEEVQRFKAGQQVAAVWAGRVVQVALA